MWMQILIFAIVSHIVSIMVPRLIGSGGEEREQVLIEIQHDVVQTLPYPALRNISIVCKNG